MHGSGTPVGDALELEGISLAIKELGGSATPFTVGSVKGNIGNTQHASGLVSLIKLCKSMQNGVVPATKGIQRPNEMINYNLPIKLATKETPVRRGDILSICASGWGGVNTHTLLGFPEERLQKRSTIPVPRSTFNRQKLAAPPKLASTVTLPASKSTGAVTSIFARHAADILGCEVGADTNLKQCGLDSKVYVTLIKAASAELTGHSIGVKGLMLPVCTPAALAQLYNDQAPAAPKQQQQKNITCSVLTRGEGASVLILPGSEGSLAGAAPFINRLPQDATVMTVEHPGLDPNQDTVDEYVSGVLTHLQPSTKLVIVGLSLGGIYAPRVAGMLGQHEDWQNTAIDVFMLDSPGLLDSVFSSKAALSSLRHPYLTFNYIGATKGGFANDETVKTQWQATFPGGKMYEVECGHTDLWGEVGCEQTAKIMEESMKPNSSLRWH
jgi:thioesterase domain-containing protein